VTVTAALLSSGQTPGPNFHLFAVRETHWNRQEGLWYGDAVIGLTLLCAALLSDLHGGNLQQTMDSIMGNRAGTAVALDVDSGRILAHYHLKVAAQRLAPPGSVVKPFTLLSLLGSGSRPRAIVCKRTLQIGGRQMDCTHPASPDPLDSVAALAYSCNYYFASVARGLRDADLVEAFSRAGLTSPTGLYAGEALGEIVPPTSVEARQLLALGEANIRITPLELVFAYRKLALQRNLSPTILNGLKAATEYGTARLARPAGVEVAGKTGTALDPASGQAHAWFAGYAPAESPRIALVVFLEQGTGGRDAAPIARELFQVALPAP
jgi:peptidoglycan glycosyltransferase